MNEIKESQTSNIDFKNVQNKLPMEELIKIHPLLQLKQEEVNKGETK